MPNEVGGMTTALPEEVAEKMKILLKEYNGKEKKNFEDILDFHVKFERIHPFQDGNGRVVRLIMFKECLKYNIVPFIIEDGLKMFYYRVLKRCLKREKYGWWNVPPTIKRNDHIVPALVSRFQPEIIVAGSSGKQQCRKLQEIQSSRFAEEK